MGLATHPPESDLFLPDLGDGTRWDPMTIFTHCSLLSIPDAAISVFLYLRCLPAFRMSQGGISVFEGLNNPANDSGVAYLDYRDTAPWPTVQGKTITSANGLSMEFVEPGRVLRLTYSSPDGETSLDVTQTAITDLFARGHIIPGEDKDSDPARKPGGSEQFMRAEGRLTLHGRRFDIHSTDCRDRSWSQVRGEPANIAGQPPVCWTPMYFGDRLIFNQVGIEPRDTHPWWSGLFDVPVGRPDHHFGWVRVDNEMRTITDVRRVVHEHHPVLYAPTRQTIDATDETGRRYKFEGEALAMASVPCWTNATLRQFLYRWTDTDTGDVAQNSGQEIWLDHRYPPHAAKRAAAEPDSVSIG